MIGLSDIEAARRRIGSHIRRTPVFPLSQLKLPIAAGTSIDLKLECLQVTGSFKARGAMNAVLGANRDLHARGIVTASGGNHGLAVARTAFTAMAPATIFLPHGVSPAKIEKMKAWNARVEMVGSVWDEANTAAIEYARSVGALYLHPFADPLVVAGQGTLGIEIIEDLPDLDLIIVAIGGGGLIAGMSEAIHALRPSVRIIGVEPTGSPTLRASMDAGRCVALEEVTTTVPTMACRQTAPAIFDIVQKHVENIVLVTDDEMREASEWLWFEMGIAADLSGAASLAALRRGIPAIAEAKKVCALVCGAGAEGTQFAFARNS